MGELRERLGQRLLLGQAPTSPAACHRRKMSRQSPARSRGRRDSPASAAPGCAAPGSRRGPARWRGREASTSGTCRLRLRGFERQHPAADRARHGERRERPARRDRFVVAIKLRRRLLAGRAAAMMARTLPEGSRIIQKPSPPMMIHVRIDGGDAPRPSPPSLRCALPPSARIGAAGFDGARMRRADDAPAMTGAVEIHRRAQRRRRDRKPRLLAAARPRSAAGRGRPCRRRPDRASRRPNRSCRAAALRSPDRKCRRPPRKRRRRRRRALRTTYSCNRPPHSRRRRRRARNAAAGGA